MSGQPTPALSYPKGMARIFKQSVKHLDPKDAPPKSDMMKGGKSDENPQGLRDRSSRTCHNRTKDGSSKVVLNKNYTENKKIKYGGDNRVKVKEPVPSLLSSIGLMERPSRIVYGHGPKRTSEKHCYRDRETKATQGVKNVARKVVINHFTEDWTSADEDLKVNMPENVPLQSTPRKQFKNVGLEEIPKMLSCIKLLGSNEVEDNVENGEKMRVIDKNLNNNNYEKETTVSNLKETKFVAERLKSSNSSLVNGKEIDTDNNVIGAKDEPEQHETSTKLMKEHQAHMEMKPSSGVFNSFKQCSSPVLAAMESSTNEKFQDNNVNISNLPLIKENLTCEREPTNYGNNVTKSEVCKGPSYPEKPISSLKLDTLVKSLKKDSSLEQKNEAAHKEPSFSPNLTENTRSFNVPKSCTINYRHVMDQKKSRLPPRFLMKRDQHREPYALESSYPTDRFCEKNKRVFISPERKARFCDFPRSYDHKVGSQQRRFQHNINCDMKTDTQSINYENFQTKDNGVKEIKGKFVDNWILPCSEDWTTELTNENDRIEVDQSSLEKELNDLSDINENLFSSYAISKVNEHDRAIGKVNEHGGAISKVNEQDRSISKVNEQDRAISKVNEQGRAISKVNEQDRTISKVVNEQDREVVKKLNEKSNNPYQNSCSFPAVPTTGVLCEQLECPDSFGVIGNNKTANDKINQMYDRKGIRSEENHMSRQPYLPPSPPSSESEITPDVTDKVGLVNKTRQGTEIITHERAIGHELETEDGSLYEAGQDKASGYVGSEKARRDVVIVDYFGSGTSDADVSELPSDEVADLSSLHSGAHKGPVVAKSQEDLLLNEGNSMRTDLATLNMQQNMPLYERSQYDYRNWWNGQYDDTYWQWYYYMYVESYRNMMNWQWQQYENRSSGNHFEHIPNQEQNKNIIYEMNVNVDEVWKYPNGRLETLDESLQSDIVTERTTNWVNSHAYDEHASKVHLLVQEENIAAKEKLHSYGDMCENLDYLNSAEKNINDPNYLVNLNDKGGALTCSCTGEDEQYVTWRMCKCGPPRIHLVKPSEPNPDLGYYSYESNLEHEDAAFLKKKRDLNCLQTNCSFYDSDWKGRALKNGSPFLYEQISGLKPPPGYQHVNMLHSTSPYRPGSATSGTRYEAGSTLDNSQQPAIETDENGNKIQGRGTSGKLKTIVDDINKSRNNNPGPCAFNHQGGGDTLSQLYRSNSAGYQQHKVDHEQSLSNPVIQSEAHLSEVQKTLAGAVKTNSDMGKSFCIMKNAIAAIQQYSDQMKQKFDDTNLSKESVAGATSCETQHTESKVDKKILSHAEFDKSDVNNGNAVPKFKPFTIRRRSDTFDCGSSSAPFTESSDDVCIESLLSQSPDTRNVNAGNLPRPFVMGTRRNQLSETTQGDPNRVFAQHGSSYGDSRPKFPGNRTSSDGLRFSAPCDYNSNTTQTGIEKKLFDTQDNGSMPRPQYGGPMQHYMFQNPQYNNPLPTSGSPFVQKTPSKRTQVLGTNSTPKSIQSRIFKLVDYGNDEDSSDEGEIEPFDVDSLSSGFNPKSVTETDEDDSPVRQYRPKKPKQNTTSDEESASPYSKPVETSSFLKRPQRKLTHRHLKDLPSDNFPKVSFVKHKKTPTKSPQSDTRREVISMERPQETGIQAGENLYSSRDMPPLPPLPPFPQSQFWSMYLPKYNSALTGIQDNVTPPHEKKYVPTTPVTPECNQRNLRKSWGGAGCAIASPSDTESENQPPKSEWKATFKRFHSFGVKYIDTHCHLDFLFKRDGFYGNLGDYIRKNPDTFPDTFEGCVAVFCNPTTFTPYGGLWKEVAKEDNVWIAMGCHPKMATDFTESAENGLKQCLQHSKCVALGEIGLDYSGSFQQHEEIQKRVFRKQLTIALQMNKPLVIHCRDAEMDCLDILKEMVPRDYKIHCHCFTGYYYNAKLWIDAFPNLYIGVTPVVTYRSARPSHDLARKLPLNRLLLETDAPYFIPRGIPKEELPLSNPGFAVTVAKEIAQYQELPVAAVLRQARLNTKFMYGI